MPGAMQTAMPAAMPGMFPGFMPGMMPGVLPGMMPNGMHGVLGAGSDVDAFIARNNIDASAAASLRALSHEGRQQVMGRGDLQDARNPNAVLMGRIRDAQRLGEPRDAP